MLEKQTWPAMPVPERLPEHGSCMVPPGFSYVYFTYGMHWMLNVITEEENFPAAVLIRAVEPTEGIETMCQRRGGKAIALLCSGPARLTEAMGIRSDDNGIDLCSMDSGLWIEAGPVLTQGQVLRTARIGLGKTPEPWLSKQWRFLVKGSPYVSKS